MVTSCHRLLRYNNTIEEDNGTLSLSFSSQTQKRQQKKTKKKEGAYLQAPTLPSHFWLPLLPFYFKCFLVASSSSQVGEKKKTIEKKRNTKKGGTFPLSSRSTLSLLGLAFALPLLPLCFKHFILAFSPFQAKKKGKKQRK
jgi:hypothetical protein